jgi:hypothetical protein
MGFEIAWRRTTTSSRPGARSRGNPAHAETDRNVDPLPDEILPRRSSIFNSTCGYGLAGDEGAYGPFGAVVGGEAPA